MSSKRGNRSLQPEEQKWLALAVQGDAPAFSKLVEMYSKPVFNLCYRMLGNPQDAEDASQEAFIRAFRSIRRYDPDRKFLTWLLSIAANYCIDQHRRVKPAFIGLDEAPGSQLAERRPGPELSAIQREQRDDVQAILNNLEARDRAAIILYYWHEYSYDEIASQLKLSESALKSRLHRARKQLAEVWKRSEKKSVYTGRRMHEIATL
jgi:RNA polymerase sigma-70 factor (ECF subfamily)